MPLTNVISFTMAEVKNGRPRVRLRAKNHRNAVGYFLRLNTNPASALRWGPGVPGNAHGKLNKRPRGQAARDMPESFNKIAEVTLAFWIIKIAATTLGEPAAIPSP